MCIRDRARPGPVVVRVDAVILLVIICAAGLDPDRAGGLVPAGLDVATPVVGVGDPPSGGVALRRVEQGAEERGRHVLASVAVLRVERDRGGAGPQTGAVGLLAIRADHLAARRRVAELVEAE